MGFPRVNSLSSGQIRKKAPRDFILHVAKARQHVAKATQHVDKKTDSFSNSLNSKKDLGESILCLAVLEDVLEKLVYYFQFVAPKLYESRAFRLTHVDLVIW